MLRSLALSTLLFACSSHPPGSAPDGGGSATVAGYTSATFASDQGQLDYQVYTPAGYHDGTPVPLVLVISGCTQTIDQLEALSRFSDLADQQTFIAAYVAQTSSRNPGMCWNWFLAADQARDTGEPSLLAGITRAVAQRWTIDPARTYVIGPSAGGAMSVVLGATYPDLYAAIGVVAGCEYGGAPCGTTGGPDPVHQGQLAYQAMGTHARPVPVIAFHGQSDTVAFPINGQQVVAQWVATDDDADNGMHDGSVPSTATSTMQGQVPGGHAYTETRYGDLIDFISIDGAGHAWPGGPAGVTFADPAGPDATAMAYAFFMAHAM